jgi:hypothetical protein
MPNTNKITGNIIANIDFRLKQIDEFSQMEDHGIIDYNLVISSGTGVAQANSIWYDRRSFTNTDSISLNTLQVRALGKTFTTSMIGASASGSIKGVKIDNLGSENIYVNLPFPNFSGSIKVLGSGSVLMSNKQGWIITSGDLISFSGDTAIQTKTYNIDLLGASLPRAVFADGILNYEFRGTGVFTNALPYDFAGSSINSGTLNYDYLIANSSIDGIIQLEYLLDTILGGSGTGVLSSAVLPIEWTSPTGFSNYLNIEFSGVGASSAATGTGCSGCGVELLANPRFDYGYVEPSSMISNNPALCTPVVGIPGWSVSGAYHTGYNGPDGVFITSNPRIFKLEAGVNANQCVWPPTITGTAAVSNGPSYIKQTVTVIPGKTYRFDWFPIIATTSNSAPINDGRNMATPNPYVRLLTGSGTELASTEVNGSWILAHAHTWQSMTGVATDTQMTVEFSHGKSVDGTDCALEWSGDNTIGYRVSLYRIR